MKIYFEAEQKLCDVPEWACAAMIYFCSYVPTRQEQVRTAVTLGDDWGMQAAITQLIDGRKGHAPYGIKEELDDEVKRKISIVVNAKRWEAIRQEREATQQTLCSQDDVQSELTRPELSKETARQLYTDVRLKKLEKADDPQGVTIHDLCDENRQMEPESRDTEPAPIETMVTESQSRQTTDAPEGALCEQSKNKSKKGQNKIPLSANWL